MRGCSEYLTLSFFFYLDLGVPVDIFSNSSSSSGLSEDPVSFTLTSLSPLLLLSESKLSSSLSLSEFSSSLEISNSAINKQVGYC